MESGSGFIVVLQGLGWRVYGELGECWRECEERGGRVRRVCGECVVSV